MSKKNSDGTDSAVSKAIDSLQISKQEKEAQSVLRGENITSLNKMLQWSTGQSGEKENNEGRRKAMTKTKQQLKEDRKWLDEAFPDPFKQINELIRMLRDDELDEDKTVGVLNGIQEYFMDLNFAINIEKLGAIDPVLKCANSTSPVVKTAALWVLGSALSDLEEVKNIFIRKNGHQVLARSLQDESPTVRAKSVMASSALLRNSSKDIQTKFKNVNGMALLRCSLSSEHSQVRWRARFFLQHARETGNEEFVTDLLTDQNCLATFFTSIEELDVESVADVEAAVGALEVLVETDKSALLRLAPELPGVIDALALKCSDHDLHDVLKSLADRLD